MHRIPVWNGCVAWATDEVPRRSRARAGPSGRTTTTSTTTRPRPLARIENTNKPLFRAYLLKEELRSIFQEADPNDAKRTFKDWLAWASRSRLPPFVILARSLRAHRDAIHDVLEAAATKLRLLTRLAFGFHSHRPLVALALLRLGGLCPPLPARV